MNNTNYMKNSQKILSQDQISAFYHDNFVKTQVESFVKLLSFLETLSLDNVVDIGGGCGYFAKALMDRINSKVSVLDSDIESINICKAGGIEAIKGDALNPTIIGDENIVCFNLILHHLIGKNDNETLKMQKHALSVWHSTIGAIFINEYIYESFLIKNFSGWFIYQITRNSILSKLGDYVAKFAPSLKANTFGTGVRFRSHEEWCKIFLSLGFVVVATTIGKQEYVSLPRRLLLIKNCRRDSFLLKPISRI